MLRRVLNLLIYSLIILIASALWPENVYVSSFLAAVSATILIWLVTALVEILLAIISFAFAIARKWGFAFATVICIFFAETIAILFISSHASWFSVSGFWTALILSFLFAVFSFQKPKKQISKNKDD